MISSLTYKEYNSQRLPKLIELGQTVSEIAPMDVIDYSKDWIPKDNTIISEDCKERLMFEINIPAIKD